MSIEIYFDDFSDLKRLQTGLNGLSKEMRGFKLILERIAYDDVIPAIQENFDTESSAGNKWPALAARTLNEKGNTPMLVRTGAMKGSATSRSAWKINNTEAEFSAARFSSKAAQYAGFHITGTRRMPQRDFAVISEKLANDIEQTVAEELEKRFSEAL